MKQKFMKRVSLLLCVALMASMTACGGGGNSSNSGSTGDNKVSIKVCDKIASTTGVNGVIYNRQKQFETAYPDIIVEHVSSVVTDSMKTTQSIVENINSEEACTLMVTTAGNYARSLYQMGLIEDWNKYLSDDEIDMLNPDVVAGLTSASGALTGFPSTLDTPLIGFNRDHLRSEYVRKQFLGDNYNADNALELIEAEIDKVSTWSEYKEVLQKLTGKYVVDFVETDVSGYGGYYTDYYLGIGVWLIANGYGISWQNENKTIEVDLTETSTVETIEFLQGLAQDGITKLNTSIGFQEYYNQVFQNKVASFIYYPNWASWFQGNSMYAEDIKVINIPVGPTAVAKITNGEDVNTNPSFANTWVMNKNATEEQKQAAAKYMLFMYGEEAVNQQYDYIIENDIENFSIPALKLSKEDLNDTILVNSPQDWKASIINALDNLYVLKPDTDVWRTYISADIPTLISKDSAYRGENLVSRLQYLNNRIKTEWLDYYNQNIVK